MRRFQAVPSCAALLQQCFYKRTYLLTPISYVLFSLQALSAQFPHPLYYGQASVAHPLAIPRILPLILLSRNYTEGP